MKRCPNQDCQSVFLYDETKTHCPICHSALVPLEDNTLEQTLIPSAIMENLVQDNNPSNPEFTKKVFGKLVCTGRVTEIEHQALFNTKLHKLLNTIFRGEPYQFAHQTQEYTIRVEPITDTIPLQALDFCLYGSYLGRIHPGDEVQITAKDKGDRRVVIHIKNLTTNTEIKPGLQISATAIRSFILVFLFLALFLAQGLFTVFTSGIALKWVSSLINSFLNVIIPIGIIIYAIRSIVKNTCSIDSDRR